MGEVCLKSARGCGFFRFWHMDLYRQKKRVFERQYYYIYKKKLEFHQPQNFNIPDVTQFKIYSNNRRVDSTGIIVCLDIDILASETKVK